MPDSKANKHLIQELRIIRTAGLCFLILGLTMVVPARDNDLRKHFRWGEYQDILEKAPARLKQDKNKQSLEDLAEIHKYYGVALFMKADSQSAENHFSQAFKMHPGLQIDSLFVTPEAFAFFNRIKADHSGAPAPKNTQWGSHLLFGAGILSAVSAGYFYLETDKYHQKATKIALRTDITEQDRHNYNDFREQFEKNERNTLLLLGTSAGFFTLSMIGYLWPDKPNETHSHAFYKSFLAKIDPWNSQMSMEIQMRIP